MYIRFGLLSDIIQFAIGSMITNTVENKFKISDIRKEINETFVDIDAQAKISLENGFF